MTLRYYTVPTNSVISHIADKLNFVDLGIACDCYKMYIMSCLHVYDVSWGYYSISTVVCIHNAYYDYRYFLYKWIWLHDFPVNYLYLVYNDLLI